MSHPDHYHPDNHRRRFLAGGVATAGAMMVLRSSAAGPIAEVRGAWAHDIRASGAIGDGIADDTAPIQSAIDAAAAAGGGTVAFPPGLYSTRTLTLRSRVHLIGAGIEATVLKLRDGTDSELLRSHRFSDLTGTGNIGGIYNWSIRDLTLDGNRARNAGGHGLCVYGYGYLLRDLRVRDCAGAGLYSEHSKDDPTLGDSMEAQIVNLKVHDCGAGGIIFRGPHDSQFVNCVVYNGTTCGIYLQRGAGSSATGCQFVNCHVWGHHAYAWKIEAGFVTLMSCMGEWAAVAQLHIDEADVTVHGGLFFGNPKARHVGIEIGSPGNTVFGTQVEARLMDLCGGALKFTNEGGSSKIKALIYQTSGIPYRGIPSRTSLLELVVNGIEDGSATVFPRGSLTWNGGSPIVKHLSGTAPWDPPEVSHGSAIVTTVRVPGASPGDTVAVGLSVAVPAGTLLSGAVTASDIVGVTLLNQTGRSLNLPAGTLRADCWVH